MYQSQNSDFFLCIVFFQFCHIFILHFFFIAIGVRINFCTYTYLLYFDSLRWPERTYTVNSVQLIIYILLQFLLILKYKSLFPTIEQHFMLSKVLTIYTLTVTLSGLQFTPYQVLTYLLYYIQRNSVQWMSACNTQNNYMCQHTQKRTFIYLHYVHRYKSVISIHFMNYFLWKFDSHM